MKILKKITHTSNEKKPNLQVSNPRDEVFVDIESMNELANNYWSSRERVKTKFITRMNFGNEPKIFVTIILFLFCFS